MTLVGQVDLDESPGTPTLDPPNGTDQEEKGEHGSNRNSAVDVAADGCEGEWYAHANGDDAVVLHLVLPDTDGSAVLAAIRDAGRWMLRAPSAHMAMR